MRADWAVKDCFSPGTFTSGGVLPIAQVYIVTRAQQQVLDAHSFTKNLTVPGKGVDWHTG